MNWKLKLQEYAKKYENDYNETLASFQESLTKTPLMTISKLSIKLIQQEYLAYNLKIIVNSIIGFETKEKALEELDSFQKNMTDEFLTDTGAANTTNPVYNACKNALISTRREFIANYSYSPFIELQSIIHDN